MSNSTNTNIDFDKLTLDNIPISKRKTNWVDWFKVITKPFRVIHDSFVATKEEYVYKVAYNGQINVLEKLLNDKFDNISRGIYISDIGISEIYYSFYDIESRVDNYNYSTYDPTTSYSIGEKALYNGKVYKSLTNSNQGNQPDIVISDWEFFKDDIYIRYATEYDQSGGFIVNIPSNVNFDEAQMRALIEFYKLAGRPYQLNII